MLKRKRLIDDLDLTTPSSVAVLEPEAVLNLVPEPESARPVMARAKEAITPFSNDDDAEALHCEIARLTKERNALFGLEKEAGFALETRISELKYQASKARSFHKFTSAKLRLDHEVLTWRKAGSLWVSDKISISLPEVGLFSLDDSVLTLRSEWLNHGEWLPSLPYQLTKLYEDVYVQMGAYGNELGHFSRPTVTLSAKFTGLIPPTTKEKIKEASTSGAFDQIRVLAETEWALNTVPGPYYADPIVVGLVQDEMWVIDVFDPTPLEDYIAREFTT